MTGQFNEKLRSMFSHRSMFINPLIKRHIFRDLPGQPDFRAKNGDENGEESRISGFGWAQLPQSHSAGFSLGVFGRRNRFIQLAFADGRGRVYMTADPYPDTARLEPVMSFNKEGTGKIPVSRVRSIKPTEEDLRGEGRAVKSVFGAIMAFPDNEATERWLASWLCADGRYTIEQSRIALPEYMRTGLEYRDALAIAFFVLCTFPAIRGNQIGFGSGNIYHNLRNLAPLRAIRTSVEDMKKSRKSGMRISGLEEFFCALMDEAGALKPVLPLESKHGAEPLHMHGSALSSMCRFGADGELSLAGTVAALRIEGALNRFINVSSYVENNMRSGRFPTEDSIDSAVACETDFALLENPATDVLSGLEQAAGIKLSSDGGRENDDEPEVYSLVRAAKELAKKMAKDNPDPIAEASGQAAQEAVIEIAGEEKNRLGGSVFEKSSSQWVYRQTLSLLLCSLRLPFRFDTQIRANLETGNVAVGFTTAGRLMMPVRKYMPDMKQRLELSDGERSEMSAEYNLRVGMIIAALAFGIDENVKNVSLHIDSLGIEEAVGERENAMQSGAEMINRALKAFGANMNPDAGEGKAGPKDGDVHGDNALEAVERLMTLFGQKTQEEIDRQEEFYEAAMNLTQTGAEENESAESDLTESDSAEKDSADKGSAESDSAESDSMHSESDNSGKSDNSDEKPKNIGEEAKETAEEIGGVKSNDNENNADSVAEDFLKSISRLRIVKPEKQNAEPIAKTIVTVTFKREKFLQMLKAAGLKNPKDFYRRFNAVMKENETGGLSPVEPGFALRDFAFMPRTGQDEPELAEIDFDEKTAKILGTGSAVGLSIQRSDLLQRAHNELVMLSSDKTISAAQKAEKAIEKIKNIGDPELEEQAAKIAGSIIDGETIPGMRCQIAEKLDSERIRARDLLGRGAVDEAVAVEENAAARLDEVFAAASGVPRYFNSYAERVIYNRLFAQPDERTVLIPDNLFYTHLELADLLNHVGRHEEAADHLNELVSYAPAYPLTHIRLAIHLAHSGDWESVHAACANALQVALDGEDAGFAYYRMAYAAWMRDDFPLAAACYIAGINVSSSIAQAENEFRELMRRTAMQNISVPQTVEESEEYLKRRGVPVWPKIKVAEIVSQASRVLIDRELFIPGKTLSLAATRMSHGNGEDENSVQVLFLRSLGA